MSKSFKANIDWEDSGWEEYCPLCWIRTIGMFSLHVKSNKKIIQIRISVYQVTLYGNSYIQDSMTLAQAKRFCRTVFGRIIRNSECLT